MLVYRDDILKRLKEKGFTTTRLRNEKLLNESAIQYLREGKPIGPAALDRICALLGWQPGSVLKWVPDDLNEK